jgi:hypothetical protein
MNEGNRIKIIRIKFKQTLSILKIKMYDTQSLYPSQ